MGYNEVKIWAVLHLKFYIWTIQSISLSFCLSLSLSLFQPSCHRLHGLEKKFRMSGRKQEQVAKYRPRLAVRTQLEARKGVPQPAETGHGVASGERDPP